MAQVLLLHSVRGLRPFERSVADRLRAEGHEVLTPDLFDGEVPSTLEEGFALEEKLWPEPLLGRAQEAAERLAAEAVLAGFSMGAAVAAEIWDARPGAAGLLLLHGIGRPTGAVRPGTPVQAHVAEPDPHVPEAWIAECAGAFAEAEVDSEIFRYPRAGHLFTDPSIDDFDAEAAALLWKRASAFLASLRSAAPPP